MKTTTYLFAAFGLAALAMTSCSNDEASADAPQGAVKIVTRISSIQSRAPQLADDGSGNFANGDVLKLAIYGSAAGAYRTDYAVGSNTLYWDDVKTNAGEQAQYTFAAWYNGAATDLVTNPSFDAAAAADPDLLLATPAQAAENATVNLNFKHAMHKLVVKVSYEGDFSDINQADVTVTPVGMNAAAAVDVQTGTVTPGEAADADGTYPTVAFGTANAAAFILAPQKLTTGADWLQFAIPGLSNPLVYKVPAQFTSTAGTATALTQLNSGEVLTLNMKIKKAADTGKTEVSLTAGQITAWGNQGTLEGEVLVSGN